MDSTFKSIGENTLSSSSSQDLCFDNIFIHFYKKKSFKNIHEMMICMAHENIILCYLEIENNFLSARMKTMHKNIIVFPQVFQGNYKESCHSSTLPSKCSTNLKTIKDILFFASIVKEKFPINLLLVHSISSYSVIDLKKNLHLL